jgi:branched-chain amino acid transport system permease protein
VGGAGSVYGTVIGAIVIGALPVLIQEYGDNIPFVSSQNVGAFSDIVVASLLVVTLITQPAGIAGMIAEVRARVCHRSDVPHGS